MRRRELGGVPVDLVFVAVAITVVIGLVGWFAYGADGWFLLVFGAVVGIAVAALLRPISKRRRADGEDSIIGHDESWASGKEED